MVKPKWDMAVDEVQTTKGLTHTNTTAITKQEATNLIMTVKLQKIILSKSESYPLFFFSLLISAIMFLRLSFYSRRKIGKKKGIIT